MFGAIFQGSVDARGVCVCVIALTRSVDISCACACRESADSRDTERQQTDNIRRAWMQAGKQTGSCTNSTANEQAHRQTGNIQLTGYAKRQWGQEAEMQTDL